MSHWLGTDLRRRCYVSSSLLLQGSRGAKKIRVIICGNDGFEKRRWVKVLAPMSTLGLLVTTFCVTPMCMFVEESICDLETILSVLRQCSKGL